MAGNRSDSAQQKRVNKKTLAAEVTTVSLQQPSRHIPPNEALHLISPAAMPVATP